MKIARPGQYGAYRFGRWLPMLGASGLVCCLVGTFQASAQDNASLSKSIASIQAVGLNGEGYEAATAAAKQLATLKSDAATAVLEAMKDASPLAKNWLRTIASDVADNGTFPRENLLAFFADRSQDTDARHAAYRMLIAADPSLKDELLESASDDPSLPIRHAAIEKLLKEADAAKQGDKKELAVTLYRKVIDNGRNPDQLQAATKSLDSLGQSVDLAKELGLVRRWWAIGTYDNAGSEHFDTVYEPETEYTKHSKLPIDWLQADKVVSGAVPGKKEAKCHLVTSDDSFGVVNINPAFENAKDAVAYCYVEIELDRALQGEARLGSITASKVWVNGKEVSANEVYHSGSRIDQYIGSCDLKTGTNTVLIKILQNAQTEPWAQDWQFQFRLTDPAGAAVKPLSQLQPSPTANDKAAK